MLFKAKLHEEFKNGFKTINATFNVSKKILGPVHVIHQIKAFIMTNKMTSNCAATLILFMKISLSKLGYIVKIAEMFKYCPKASK